VILIGGCKPDSDQTENDDTLIVPPETNTAKVKPTPPKGIDIMLVLDASYSMQEGTLEIDGKKVTYFDAMKRIVSDFIRKHPNDRIGAIAFAVQPSLVCPLTADHKFLIESIDKVKMDLGTSVGSSLVTAAKALEGSPDSRTRIMVLITDGNNNIGVSPFKAARYAKSKGIRIYPVEITNTPIVTPRKLAAHPLHNVAKTSNGQFFQATNYKSLAELYKTISALSSTDKDDKSK